MMYGFYGVVLPYSPCLTIARKTIYPHSHVNQTVLLNEVDSEVNAYSSNTYNQDCLLG